MRPSRDRMERTLVIEYCNVRSFHSRLGSGFLLTAYKLIADRFFLTNS